MATIARRCAPVSFPAICAVVGSVMAGKPVRDQLIEELLA
jgi:hypothetical protein